MKFQCPVFDALSIHELYEIIQLRSNVFVLEQTCLFLDPDGRDQQSHHLQLRDTNSKLCAYARIMPPGLAYEAHASIGRVCTHPNDRRKKLGKMLMQQAIETCIDLYPNAPIRIGAQAYLQKFYTDLGFIDIGHAYIEDEIPHLSMDYTRP